VTGEQVGEFDAHEAVMVDEVGELDGVDEVGGVFEGLMHEEADAGNTFLEVGVGGEVASGVGGVGVQGEVFEFGGVDFASGDHVLGDAIIVLKPGGSLRTGNLVVQAGNTREKGNGIRIDLGDETVG
jgi:hypothetical protein